MSSKQFEIDNITWNDLNLEEIYNDINVSGSSVGSEYLKYILKHPLFDGDLLRERNNRVEFFKSADSERTRLKKIFKNLGRTRKVSFLDYIFKLAEAPTGKNTIHFVLITLLIIAIILVFIKPVIGIIGVIVMIAVNISTYFKFKNSVEAYFNCVKYLVSMVVAAKALIDSNALSSDSFNNMKAGLGSSIKTFSSVKRSSWLITNSVSGSLIDVLMDYIRMIFHVDIIKFNNMRNTIVNNCDQVKVLYDALGEIEADICIAEYRNRLRYYCTPDINNTNSDRKKLRIICDNIYHPLIAEPVANSISTDKSVLLSGSNASGKSTFLKAMAVNQIFAQTIYTCLSSRMVTFFSKVMSSMALTDSILNKESYFIVEIKSLKRIFDELEGIPVVCFIDEVLRGTNTIERIAASSRILEKLSEENCIVFAATHDIELTELLKDKMVNYHFSEKVEHEKVIFDYKLKDGATDTSNAIKLLKEFRFDDDIVDGASKRAENFKIRGVWE